MGFQTPQYKLAKLLDQAASGTIQLPDFQRGYKWDEERIRSLLVTIMLGHPLGVIMFLETGNNNVRFKPKPIEGADISPKVEPSLLLLDGQQRLTSLYQSMTRTGVVQTEDARRKQVQRRFFINIRKALDPADRDEAVMATPADGVLRSNFNRDIELDLSTEDLQREHGYFPFSIAFDQSATNWLFDLDDRNVSKRFLNEILQPMLAYEIPAIQLDKETTKGAVATVFEKVNTGGLPLNVFELLTATFAGDADYYAQHQQDFRLNDDWLLTAAILDKYPVLANLKNSDFLQAVTLLATAAKSGQTSARKEDILKLELADYLDGAPRIRNALEQVAMFLDGEHIHTAWDVPYPTQVVPLAVIFATLGDDASLHGVHARLRQWFWCGVLGELYGSTTETRFARDVDQVPGWARVPISAALSAPLPGTVSDASFFESRLLSLRRRNSAAYKGIYALLMATGCMDWRENKPFDHAHYLNLAVDIHHIFPQAWCKQNDIDEARRESIVNKTPLGAKTNRSIGGQSPATYLPLLERTARIDSAALDAIVATHLIDVDALRAADFDRFHDTRRAALLTLVETAMGKPAQRDMASDDPTAWHDSPADFADEPDDPTDGPTAADVTDEED